MNIKMVRYYEDILKYAEDEKHIKYAKEMRDYYLGLRSRPIIMDGTIAKNNFKAIS